MVSELAILTGMKQNSSVLILVVVEDGLGEHDEMVDRYMQALS